MLRKIFLSFLLCLACTLPAFATVNSTVSRSDYIGNAAVSTYSYGYRIFSNTDLLVTVRDTSDVETTLTLTTDYTVTGVGSSTGTIVLVNSSQAWLTSGKLKTGYTLTIRRVRPLKQSTDIRNQGPYFPEIHEDAFDSVVMIAQQHQDEIDRSIKLPETIDPDDFDASLPPDLATVPGSSIIVNDDGDGFSAGPTADEISGATASAAAAAASASASSTSASAASTSAAAAQAAASSIINLWGGTVGGTANAITLTPSPALGAYAAGISYTFLATGTNSTAVTVAVSGLTAKSIKTQSGAALTSGNITSGRVYTIVYDGTNFICKELATPEDGVITNAKINASAAIAYSKLNLGTSITRTDIATGFGLVPTGGIIEWSGAISAIPTGWLLCDGTNSTPDLRSRFIVGAGADGGTHTAGVDGIGSGYYAPAATGGADKHAITIAEMPSHHHTYYNPNTSDSTSGSPESAGGRNPVLASTTDTGGDTPHDMRPPYYALAYIMKS